MWQSMLRGQSRYLKTVGAGNTLIIAPHQDDETLACGGLIHQRVRAGACVAVVFLTDGSQNVDLLQLKRSQDLDIRAREAKTALGYLGVSEHDTHFLGLPDGRLSTLSLTQRRQCTADLLAFIQRYRPDDLLIPYRSDGHADHEAAWVLTQESVARLDQQPRVLEYLIWLPWVSTARMLQLILSHTHVHELAITTDLIAKHAAIRSYASQLSTFPRGFLERFLSDFELYLSPGASS